jgi:hypothetical protein
VTAIPPFKQTRKITSKRENCSRARSACTRVSRRGRAPQVRATEATSRQGRSYAGSADPDDFVLCIFVSAKTPANKNRDPAAHRNKAMHLQNGSPEAQKPKYSDDLRTTVLLLHARNGGFLIHRFTSPAPLPLGDAALALPPFRVSL